jgi:two-component system cell cycle response regulator
MANADTGPRATRIEKILAVDNDAVMLTFLNKLFDKAGLESKTARDGVAAIDALETYTPDLFFIDLVMPNIDGRSLCRIVRSKPRFKTTPIVIISAIAAEEAPDLVSLGANLCIAKVAFADMAEMVQRILDEPALLHRRKLSNRVLGVKDLAPRNITNEMLLINRHYETMLQSITNGIVEIDTRNRIIFANPAACTFFDKPVERLLGGWLMDLFPETDQAPLLDLVASCSLVRGQPCGTIATEVADRIFSVSAAAAVSGEDHKVLIMEDITAREKARQALVQANSRLEAMAKIDSLTNVSNRRHFDELFDREWRRMIRENGRLSLMLCDVDHFKGYNDTYGHLDGDQCLQDVARAIVAVVNRPSDTVARYGGDEFVVILPNTALDGALHVAEDIRRAVEALGVAHSASPVADHVTMTIGVGSVTPSDGLAANRLVSATDHALYEAKSKGRNCAVGKELTPPKSNDASR